MGLREQRKAETELAIREAAMDLFLAYGYEGTTIETIAEVAQVSPRTVYRYFTSKEEILFRGAEEEGTRLRILLDAQPADAPLMVAVRAVLEVTTRAVLAQRSKDLRLARLLEEVPALRARYLSVLDHIERSVAGWAAERLGVPVADWRPRLLAACMVSAHRVVTQTEVDSEEDLVQLLEGAVSQLGRGLDDLVPAPRPSGGP